MSQQYHTSPCGDHETFLSTSTQLNSHSLPSVPSPPSPPPLPPPTNLLPQIYNTLFIRWTTHNPSGLSSKDILMTQFTDSTASALGELEAEKEEGKEGGKEEVMRGLIDSVKGGGGEKM